MDIDPAIARALGFPRPQSELRTERLLLRSFEASDVDDVLAYATDPEFRRFLAHLPEGYGRGAAEAFVARNISESWEKRRTFALVLGDTVIGALSFDVDAPKRSAMLGYAMGRPWWGQGLMLEAARVAIDWAVHAYGLRRVWASADVRHLRSQRVMEKLGMQREDLCAAHHLGRQGEPVDEVVFAMNLPAS